MFKELKYDHDIIILHPAEMIVIFSRILILTLYIDNLCKTVCPFAVGNYASVISWIFDLCIG